MPKKATSVIFYKNEHTFNWPYLRKHLTYQTDIGTSENVCSSSPFSIGYVIYRDICNFKDQSVGTRLYVDYIYVKDLLEYPQFYPVIDSKKYWHVLSFNLSFYLPNKGLKFSQRTLLWISVLFHFLI